VNLDLEALAERRRTLALESAMLRSDLRAQRHALGERAGSIATSPVALGAGAALVALAMRVKAWRWIARLVPMVALGVRLVRAVKQAG
jgi:hypothetical protein